MDRKLYPTARYPDGHPDLATGLNNLGGLLHDQGAYREAARRFREALEMNRTLYPARRYPNGHPKLALNLSNLAGALREMGAYAEARKTYEQAVQALRLTPHPVQFDQGPAVAMSLRPDPLTCNVLNHLARLTEKALPPRPALAELRQSEQVYALVAAVHDRLRGEALRRESDKLR